MRFRGYWILIGLHTKVWTGKGTSFAMLIYFENLLCLIQSFLAMKHYFCRNIPYWRFLKSEIKNWLKICPCILLGTLARCQPIMRPNLPLGHCGRSYHKVDLNIDKSDLTVDKSGIVVNKSGIVVNKSDLIQKATM